jgi:hypothetical protein
MMFLKLKEEREDLVPLENEMAKISFNPICSKCGWTLYIHDDGILEHFPSMVSCSNNGKKFRLIPKDKQEGDYTPLELVERVYSVEFEEINDGTY